MRFKSQLAGQTLDWFLLKRRDGYWTPFFWPAYKLVTQVRVLVEVGVAVRAIACRRGVEQVSWDDMSSHHSIYA